ncbi:hypothetical protein HNY73_013557 [Argiope bruennichi]|uniref:Uncharacterized protein n=1 Tax=Argiope bruennichi TaxID=94029 RepID=A0A8T0F4G6_ARGBR|nr:hypothetical protein HNY73_013557 [Argiope bruennichi]
MAQSDYNGNYNYASGSEFGRLDHVLKAEVVGKDLRGQAEGSSRKTSENLVNDVKQHIQRFLQFESHYTRNHNPGRKYLNPELNARSMHNFYVDQCTLNQRPYVNEWIDRNIFKTQFNLYFHRPRKDAWIKCDMLNMKIKISCNIQEQQNLREQYEMHLINSEMARKSLHEDRNMVANNPENYFAFSFDLQKTLPYPKLTVTMAYYKRNMYVLNQGFHNFHNDEINMYVWDDTIAYRGAQEVASCCLKHLQTVTTPKHIIAYSDMHWPKWKHKFGLNVDENCSVQGQ